MRNPQPESLKEAWESWLAEQMDVPPHLLNTLQKVFFVGAMAAHHLLVVKIREDMQLNDEATSVARLKRFEDEMEEFVNRALRESARRKAQREAMNN